MKKLIFIFVVFTFNILNAQYYSYTNIKNLPQNEYFTYKGISSKKDKIPLLESSKSELISLIVKSNSLSQYAI